MTLASLSALATPQCPLCGGSNECAPAQTGNLNTPCWCTTVSISTETLARVPADQINKACLCPRCAADMARTI
jgi:hypothetical protein